MMLKLSLLFLALPLGVLSQINVDSLRNKLDANYTIVGYRSYLMEKFTSYVSHDSLDKYDLFLDSTKTLRNHIDLAIVHRSYDSQNRIVLIEGYDSLGNRSYWDFPAKTIFQYIEDTSIIQLNKIFKQIGEDVRLAEKCSVLIDYEIENNPKYSKIRYHIYSKDSTFLFTYSICSSGNVCRRANNVYYELYKLADNKRSYSANYFFGDDLKLIDGSHQLLYNKTWGAGTQNFDYAYAILTLDANYGKTQIDYFNKRKKLVHTSDFESVGLGIVDGTTTKKLTSKEKKQFRKINKEMRKNI